MEIRQVFFEPKETQVERTVGGWFSVKTVMVKGMTYHQPQLQYRESPDDEWVVVPQIKLPFPEDKV